MSWYIYEFMRYSYTFTNRTDIKEMGDALVSSSLKGKCHAIYFRNIYWIENIVRIILLLRRTILKLKGQGMVIFWPKSAVIGRQNLRNRYKNVFFTRFTRKHLDCTYIQTSGESYLESFDLFWPNFNKNGCYSVNWATENDISQHAATFSGVSFRFRFDRLKYDGWLYRNSEQREPRKERSICDKDIWSSTMQPMVEEKQHRREKEADTKQYHIHLMIPTNFAYLSIGLQQTI